MTRPLIDRKKFDHPEHFDDEIRAYRTSKRYVPTPLEQLLYELAAHRCTICAAPWVEIHHIDELGDGGKTEYENLIVLCPNCHTRVHSEGIPTKQELRQYKLKQEIAYELPVLSRLTNTEREFVVRLAKLPLDEQITFSQFFWSDEFPCESGDAALQQYRKEVGFFLLQEFGIISLDTENVIECTFDKPRLFSVSLRARLTGKGVKWLQYLRTSNQLAILDA
jgi:HNH endonuclease